ncbi:Crp/Fnr family transcriptional regulator [Robertmurraya andreesenii]|uniref:CRP/FNR family transcriptional regulator n=1 Tax=Anoxybacillus andreesenii TaxID=1325932 RepID=A0ABT9UZG1_9BACL|nr:Crp/Fnr family transcriptional regulator [Robertmurraya andreesenii]MDQ0154035.1 CRP/FNR family transcriptional regulator [Robertmurraya andreesenii]
MPNTLKPTKSIEIKELLHIADRIIQVEKGQYLFQEGQDAGELYLVISGKIQISKITADGRELSLRICSENDICGELTLFTNSPKYLLSALMLEDGEIAVIKKEMIEEKIFQDSALGFEFIKWMSDHFRKTQMKFRDLVLYGKKGALYSTLIRMTNSYGVEQEDGILIDLPLTNQELGNFCGTTRESTNHLLNELKRKGVISIEKKKITIHDLQYIKKEIDCENCPAVFCSIE